jgi:hypothetical protein
MAVSADLLLIFWKQSLSCTSYTALNCSLILNTGFNVNTSWKLDTKLEGKISTHLLNHILAWFVSWVSETWIFHEARWCLHRNGATTRLLRGWTHHVFLGYSVFLHSQRWQSLITPSPLCTLGVIVEQSLEWCSKLYFNFVDFEREFNGVSRENIWKILKT